MSRTLSIGSLLFRTRSAERDERTDLERMMPVRAALAAAVESASRERSGMQQRLDLYCMQAATLMDNSPEYPQRPAEEEDAIAEAERHVAAVRRRLGQLETQIGKLTGMLAQLDDIEGTTA